MNFFKQELDTTWNKNEFQNYISASETDLLQVQSAPKESSFGKPTYRAEIHLLIPTPSWQGRQWPIGH